MVTGAGMLGVTAVAMATRAGAHVVAVDPHPDRRDRALRFGAAEVRDASDVPPDGIDLAVELSGSATAVEACVAGLAVGGTAVLAGSVSPGRAVALDPERLVRRLNRIVGVHNYRAVDLVTAVGFLAANHHRYPLAELVGGPFDLDEIDLAFDAARSGALPRQAIAPAGR